MIWLSLAAAATVTESPVGSAASAIIAQILGYGVVGCVALAFAFGWIKPASSIREVREQARADLKTELDRTIAEKQRAEEQRDEALRVARDQIVPILTSFTASAGSLIPLLQELVARREGWHDRDRGDRR